MGVGETLEPCKAVMGTLDRLYDFTWGLGFLKGV